MISEHTELMNIYYLRISDDDEIFLWNEKT